MRVVLDTNVFISGIFFTGPPYRILKAWRDGRIRLVISQEILEEYKKVAEELGEQFPQVHLEWFLDLVTAKSEMVIPTSLHEQVCQDPDDDKFLACALAGKKAVVVSGDKHLLRVSGYQGLVVLRPREFVDRYL